MQWCMGLCVKEVSLTQHTEFNVPSISMHMNFIVPSVKKIGVWSVAHVPWQRIE